MFRQSIVNGYQKEQPDYWLTFGNPWEIERLMVQYPIKFYGHVSATTEEGKQVRWGAQAHDQCTGISCRGLRSRCDAEKPTVELVCHP